MPFLTVTFVLATVTFVVFTAVFCTFTVTVFFRPLARVIWSFAVPAFFALILQVPFSFPFTVKILVLVDFHVFTESPFAKPVIFKPEVDCFTFSFTLEAFTVAVAFKAVPTVFVSFSPQVSQILSCCSGAKTVASAAIFQSPNLCPVALIASVSVTSHLLQVLVITPSAVQVASLVTLDVKSCPNAGIFCSSVFSSHLEQCLLCLPSVVQVAFRSTV